jgi:hypothetical protein
MPVVVVVVIILMVAVAAASRHAILAAQRGHGGGPARCGCCLVYAYAIIWGPAILSFWQHLLTSVFVLDSGSTC